jgi:two-component sensor histidine kinase
MQDNSIDKKYFIWLCLASAGVVFLIDISLPLGIAGGVPYVLVVLIALSIHARNAILYVAVLCSVLTVLGYFTSPIGGEPLKVLANRSLALFAIWSVALLGLSRRRAEDAVRKVNEHLEERVENRTRKLIDEVAVRRRAEEALLKAHANLERKVDERTIELRQEVEERKQAEGALKVLLGEKEVLMKEIHHRVKNNLQVVTSLLNLQSQHIDDEAMRNIFMDSQSRIKSMAMIHEKLYQSENISQIDFSDYITNLTASIFSSYRVEGAAVELELDIPRMSLDIDTCVKLGLIINELCTNSLKYAFPDGRDGVVSIELITCSEGICMLIVKDDGIGLPDGFDIANSSSMGLQLISAMVTQLKGRIEIDSDEGASFKIYFTCQGSEKGQGL